MTLYHLADPEQAARIDAIGFRDETGTYKHTGVALDGVFFSETYVDSNEDEPGNVVYAVEADGDALERYEIIEDDASHRSFSIPAAIANTFARRRLAGHESAQLRVVDRRTDPAFPHESTDRG